MSTRDSKFKLEAFTLVLDQIQKGFKINSTESIHGSLLAYKELFLQGKMFLFEKFQKIVEEILIFKDFKDEIVRKIVIELLPILASYNSIEFIKFYLHKSMVYLLGQLKKDKDKTSCFHSIGHISLYVKVSMSPYLDAILVSVKQGLLARGFVIAFSFSRFDTDFLSIGKKEHHQKNQFSNVSRC